MQRFLSGLFQDSAKEVFHAIKNTKRAWSEAHAGEVKFDDLLLRRHILHPWRHYQLQELPAQEFSWVSDKQCPNELLRDS